MIPPPKPLSRRELEQQERHAKSRKTKDPITGLTKRQDQFIRHYMTYGDKCAAYREAYQPSATQTLKNQQNAASVLLSNPSVKKFLAKCRKDAASASTLSMERVNNELSKIAFSDLPDFVDNSGNLLTIEQFQSLTPAQRSCIKKVRQTPQGMLEIELHDKIAALRLLGIALGGYTEKNKGGDGQPLQVTLNL